MLYFINVIVHGQENVGRGPVLFLKQYKGLDKYGQDTAVEQRFYRAGQLRTRVLVLRDDLISCKK